MWSRLALSCLLTVPVALEGFRLLTKQVESADSTWDFDASEQDMAGPGLHGHRDLESVLRGPGCQAAVFI